MAEFDPIRAQREIVAGLVDVYKVIQNRKRTAEQRAAEAEIEHTSLAKLESFTRGLLDQATAKLRALEDAQR